MIDNIATFQEVNEYTFSHIPKMTLRDKILHIILQPMYQKGPSYRT